MSESMALPASASPSMIARAAGVLYLVIIVGVVVIGPFHVGPSGILGLAIGEALPTVFVDSLMGSEGLWTLAGAAQLLILVCDVGVALLLYELLKAVDRGLSMLSAILQLLFVAIAAANLVNHYLPLILVSGAGYLDAWSPQQLRGLALAFVAVRTLGFDVALVFFGLHLVVAGYLIARSTFLPRVLGVLLALGGLGYIANVLFNVVPPGAREIVFPAILAPAVGEIIVALWLTVVGVNDERWRAQAASSPATGSRLATSDP